MIHLKRFLSLFILAIAFIFISSCQRSNIFDFILHENATESLVVVTNAEYPPFAFFGQSNRSKHDIIGVDIELAKAIAYDMGKNLRIVHRSFVAVLPELRSNRADVAIAALSVTEERAQTFDFSHIYFGSTSIIVTRLADAHLFQSLTDLNSPLVRIGALMGSIQAEILINDFANSITTILPTAPGLLNALNNHNIDALIIEDVVFYGVANQFPHLKQLFELPSDNPGFAVMINKNQPELLNSINQTIERLKTSDDFNVWFAYFNALESDFNLFSWYTLWFLLQGLSLTIIFSILAVTLGTLLAFIPAFMRLSKKKIIRYPAAIIIDIIRGTPLLVQVMILYALIIITPSVILGVDIGAFIPGLIAMMINCMAYISEIIRGGILTINKGQFEASRSLGLTLKQTYLKIILPQAIKNILPSLGNEFITIIKETSIFMYLGIAELMFQANIIIYQTFRPIAVLLIAAFLYLIITIPLSKIMNYLEKQKRGEKPPLIKTTV